MNDDREPDGAVFADIDVLRRLLDPAVDLDKELADQPRLRELIKILRGDEREAPKQ